MKIKKIILGIFITALLFSFSGNAFAAFTIGTTSASYETWPDGFTRFFNVTAGDSVLVLTVVTYSASDRTGGAPSFDGQTLTQAGTTKRAVSGEAATEIWYLYNPPVGNLLMAVPNTGGLDVRGIMSVGIASSGKVALIDASGGNTGTSTNPTATVTTTQAGDIMYSIVGSGANTWNSETTDGGGTNLVRQDAGNFGSSVQYKIGSAAATENLGWVFGTSDDWAISTVAFKEITSTSIKTIAGTLKASVKTVFGLAIGSVKTIMGLP